MEGQRKKELYNTTHIFSTKRKPWERRGPGGGDAKRGRQRGEDEGGVEVVLHIDCRMENDN